MIRLAPARLPASGNGDLRRLAAAIRLHAVRMVAPHGFGYLGQALSAAEQYAAVYGAALRPGTDRVVCSPAHYVIAAYAAAARTGLLDGAILATYGQDGSALGAIGTEHSPVPDYTCGSLGQGLSAAAGFALADRLRDRPEIRTFAFLSEDATETAQVVAAIADLPGPVYLRLKRGEIPVIFPRDHQLSLDHAQVLVDGRDATGLARGTTGGGATTGGGVTHGGAEIAGGAVTSGGGVTRGGADTVGRDATSGGAETEGGAESEGGAVTEGGAVSSGGGVTGGGAETAGRGGMGVWPASTPDAAGQLRAPAAVPGSEVALLVSGMMVAPALAAARVLRSAGIATLVLNIPVIKPLDTATVLAAAAATQTVITAENHSTIGGLGSAVAETLAEAALPRPLHRLGLQDTYAEPARTPHYLFQKYGLSTQHLVEAAWSVLHRPGTPPRSLTPAAGEGEYAPV